MARYDLIANETSLFQAAPAGASTSWLLYSTSTSIGILNADGSRTFFTGAGFVWDAVNQYFSAGEVTAIHHYTAAGAFIDSLTGILAAPNNIIQSMFAGNTGNLGLLDGNDVLEARFRAGNLVVNDTLAGGYGNDLIMSGSGNDLLIGGGYVPQAANIDNDRLYAGLGNDVLRGDEALSLAGTDQLFGERGHDVLFGAAGNDLLSGGLGVDTAVFSARFADLEIAATATGFTVHQSSGETDTLLGIERIAADDGIYQFDPAAGAWALISALAGQSLAFAGTTRNGTAGADEITLYFGDGTRTVNGLRGNDTIKVTSRLEDVLVRGGAGNDAIEAGGETARLYGDSGNDVITGGFFLDGGAGDDSLKGGSGLAVLTGGLGADTFNFTLEFYQFHSDFGTRGWGRQTITDFQVGTDHIAVETLNGAAFAPTITDSADGLLLTQQLTGNTPAANGIATILFQGVHGNLTLDDLML